MNHNFVHILLEYPKLSYQWLIQYFRTRIILIHDRMINQGKERPAGCCQKYAGTSPEKAEGEYSSIPSKVNAGER